MKEKFAILIVLFSIQISAQKSFFEKSDSLNAKRLILSSGIIGATSIASITALNAIWYDDFQKTKLHSFNDSKNWLQMDKVGHAYASYHFSEIASKMHRWSGMQTKRSAIIGSSIGWAYQFSIELLDGKSSGWGFSWSDITANTLGCLLFVGQEIAFEKQMVKLKFSYFPSKYAKFRPEVLGSTFSEQLLKDYNAQTYWLSFSPFQFKKESKLKWFSLALGYSVDEKLIGDQEYFMSSDMQNIFRSKRELVLSLDIDVRELPIKKKWLKTILSPFNSIKIPFPSLIWNGRTMYGKIY